MSNKYDPKKTNPKDAIGGTKLPLDLIPDTGLAYTALAFLEGALKYGRFNWRIAGVRWSVYEAAMRRHLWKVKEGEWTDPVTKVPHIGSIMACLMILADAYEQGMLIDDRPPSNTEASDFIDGFVLQVENLKRVFAKHNPKQYTIKDTPDDVPRTGEQTDSSYKQAGYNFGVPGEDAQPVPGRDTGPMVLRQESGSVGGVQMVKFDTFTEDSSEARLWSEKINGLYICNWLGCTEAQCIANRVAQGQKP